MLENLHESQRTALAGVFVLFFPILLSPNFFRPLGRASPNLFSEWNAPRPRHLRLLQGALDREISIRQQVELWSPLPDQGWKPCNRRAVSSLPERSQGFLQVFLDGGLNQQRMGICDAVAVAKILNVTLVIPRLEVNHVWQDSSSVCIQSLWSYLNDNQYHPHVYIAGVFVNGPYVLITTAVAADLGTHKSLKGNARALATVTAIIDGTGSVGAAIGPVLTGYISAISWDAVFYMLMTAALISGLLLTQLIISEVKTLLYGSSEEDEVVAASPSSSRPPIDELI